MSSPDEYQVALTATHTTRLRQTFKALNAKLRRAVRTRGHFPGDGTAMKLRYLVLNHAAQKWKRRPREWAEVKARFAVMFGEKFVI